MAASNTKVQSRILEAAFPDARALRTPPRISPASAAEQKHNYKNDQYGFHVSTSRVRGSWLNRLTSSVGIIL
jgi:hypothetical protein